MNRFRVWFELCQLPRAVPVIADPLAGALLAGAGWRDSPYMLVLMAASGCLYVGGVVFSQWYSFKKDLVENPDRPLPSKKIHRFKALLLAIVLLVLGGLLASIPTRASTKVGILLIGILLTYTTLVRDVPIAPAIMGGYRALNLLLGMTLVPQMESVATAPMRTYMLTVMGIYILGVAIFSGTRTNWFTARRLLAGSSLTWLAVILIALLGFFFPERTTYTAAAFWLAILLLANAYRMTQAILTPKPQNVQIALKTAWIGVILLDAAMVAFVRGFLFSCLVAILLVPAIRLGPWLGLTEEPAD